MLPFPFQFLQCQNIIDVYEDIADLAGVRREALLPSSVATSAVKEQDPEKLLAAFRTAVEVVVKQVKPLHHADQHFANTTSRNIITTIIFLTAGTIRGLGRDGAAQGRIPQGEEFLCQGESCGCRAKSRRKALTRAYHLTSSPVCPAREAAGSPVRGKGLSGRRGRHPEAGSGGDIDLEGDFLFESKARSIIPHVCVLKDFGVPNRRLSWKRRSLSSKGSWRHHLRERGR